MKHLFQLHTPSVVRKNGLLTLLTLQKTYDRNRWRKLAFLYNFQQLNDGNIIAIFIIVIIITDICINIF